MRIRLLLLIAVLTCNLLKLQSQTLYVPAGTNGVGTSTNENVGVGTNQPAEKFEVFGGNLKTSGVIYSTADGYAQTFLRSWGLNGNGTIYIEPSASHDLYLTDSWSKTGMLNVQFGKTIFESGNVGIGTTNPMANLHIGKQEAPASTAGQTTRLILQPYGHTGGPWNFICRDSPEVAYLDILYGSGQALTINSDRYVGIGTTNPQNTLDVNGTIHAREVKVDLTCWSDFVFHPSYRLKSLIDVEKYIKANGHLESIPSAAEVEQNGVNVGEMQKKLLQKVEELTLYVIEKDKQLMDQNKIINYQQQLLLELKKEMESMKTLINDKQ